MFPLSLAIAIVAAFWVWQHSNNKGKSPSSKGRKARDPRMPVVHEMTAQDKVTAEWDVMAGEWDDMAGAYRDAFVNLLWEETGYTTAEQQKDLVVVDFGCATGLLTEAIRSRVRRVVSIDVAPSMVDVLKGKIQMGDWQNVDAYCGVAANLDATPDVKKALDALKGKVDIVAASSVLNFVPDEDMEATMQVLRGLLKPGTGMLCHSDWPKGEHHPYGFTQDKAAATYKMGGLVAKTTKTITMKMGSYEMPVFVGVATRGS